jgi:ABC-type glutathione transport system ATPase component
MQKNYEAIIDINSLASIISDGWHIHINPESKYKNVFDLTKALDKEYKTFALTGPFGAGKTFITNLLAGTGLMSGETVHTLGISIYLKQLIAFIDTAGSGNPVKMDADAILDRRLTDFYIEEVVKDTAQGHIHVVNRMTNLIEEKLMSLMRQTDEYILIIHNLRNVKTL